MIYQLLPRIHWQRVRPNRLLVYLPNSVLRVEGIDLSCVVDAVLSQASGGSTRETLRDAARAKSGVKPGIIDYAVELLVESRALFVSEASKPLTDLQAYYYLTENNIEVVQRLSESNVVCFCFVEDGPLLSRAFEIAGLGVDIRALKAHEAVSFNDLGSHDAVACLGIPFHHRFTRSLNSWAIEASSLVLFSEYRGDTARVGPTVIGRNLACLDCVAARHNANGGGEALEAVKERNPQIEGAGLTPPLCHPILRDLLLQHSVLEMSRILLRNAPASFGGYLEVTATGSTTRREVLRVPRCVACSAGMAERYPFDAVAVS